MKKIAAVFVLLLFFLGSTIASNIFEVKGQYFGPTNKDFKDI